MSSDFDYIELREYCFYPDSIPSLEDLLEASKDISDEGKTMIFDYLERIAGSDSDVGPDEKQLLDRVKTSLEFSS